MLFMITSQSLPGKSDETIKKAFERRNVSLEGIKVIGSWVYPWSGRQEGVCMLADVYGREARQVHE